MAESTEPKPLAITKLVRDETTGGLMTIFVDAATGLPLDTLDGYDVVNEAGDYLDPELLGELNLDNKEKDGKPAQVTGNPLDQQEEITRGARKASGGDTRDSRNNDRTGFNAYGPDGKDITDTKLGKMGVGFMGGMGGKIGGAIIGGAVGGPIGALVGGLAGGVIGKKAFSKTSPHAKKQAEEEAKKPGTKKGGIITRALGIETKKGLVTDFVDKMFNGTLTDEDVEDAPTPTARPENNTAVSAAATARPNNPLGIGTVDYAHPERGPWQQGLTQDTIDTANRLTGTLDNPTISSAYRSPAVNAAVGGAPGSAHKRGMAFDMATSNMTDDEKQKAVEMSRLAGAKRIGTYPDESLHFDMLEGYNPNADPKYGMIDTVDDTYGMYDRTGYNAATRAPGWFTAGMTQDRFAPTPTARPTTATTGFASADDRTSTGNVKNAPANVGQNTADALSYSQDVNEAITSSITDRREATTDLVADKFSGVDLTNASPAQMATLGFSSRNKNEVSAMAKTIAGELSGSTLRGLAKNDPVAKQELAGVIASMENRANSQKFGTLKNTLTPSQYNSLATTNLDVTNANYARFGNILEKNINDFYTGVLKPDDYKTTSYYNPDIASPKWGGVMTNPMNIGEHKFGVLDGKYDYGPSTAFKTERERMAKAQVSDTRGFTPERSYSGSDFGNLDSPGEGAGRFGGGMGGGVSTDRSSRLGGPVDRSEKGWSGSSGGVKSDKSSYGGGPVDRGEKGWGGSSKSSYGGGIKSDKSSYGGGPVDKGEKGWGGNSKSSSSKSSKSSSSGLGKSKDGSDNGWGGRSGSV